MGMRERRGYEGTWGQWGGHEEGHGDTCMTGKMERMIRRQEGDGVGHGGAQGGTEGTASFPPAIPSPRASTIPCHHVPPSPAVPCASTSPSPAVPRAGTSPSPAVPRDSVSLSLHVPPRQRVQSPSPSLLGMSPRAPYQHMCDLLRVPTCVSPRFVSPAGGEPGAEAAGGPRPGQQLGPLAGAQGPAQRLRQPQAPCQRPG